MACKKDSGPRIGIIQFVWITILGITCGAILFARNFEVFQTGKIAAGMRPEYYAQLAAELNFLMGKLIDLTMVLGSVLAVSMSILWSRDVWREKEPEGPRYYEDTSRAALAMSFAFFVVLVSVGLWMWLPLYLNYASLKDFLR